MVTTSQNRQLLRKHLDFLLRLANEIRPSWACSHHPHTHYSPRWPWAAGEALGPQTVPPTPLGALPLPWSFA